MDVIGNVKKIIDENPDDSQLDQYLSDVKDSLTTTNKQFIAFQFFFLFTLTIYHLIVHEGWSGITIGSIKIKDVSLFDRIFLIVPSAIFLMLSAVGYLRKLQREVYDYLAISRLRVLGQTGVHELRLPSNYILGFDILRHEGGTIGKAVSYVAVFILSFSFFVGPSFYMLYEAIANVIQYGHTDPLVLIVSVITALSVLIGHVIIKITNRVNA